MRAMNENDVGFSGVVGAIDGCHIPLQLRPSVDGDLYVNRKKSIRFCCKELSIIEVDSLMSTSDGQEVYTMHAF